MKGASDAGTFQRLAWREFIADCHKAGHLGFGDADLFSSPGCETEVGNVEVNFDWILDAVHVFLIPWL